MIGYGYGLNGCFLKQNFFFQAEDGIRDLVRSRGLGDVYKEQVLIIMRTSNFYLRPPFVPTLEFFPIHVTLSLIHI